MNRSHCQNIIPLIFALAFLTSCAENLPQNISSTYTAPYQYTFNVPYSQAWKGAIQTLNAKDRVKTIDKESGLIVTEYMTVNKQVLTMFQTALFGRTYKNSYSITMNESGPGRTSITVQSNLMMEQFGFYNRERNVEWFEAYLREDLFSRLCTTYYQDPRQCNAVFYNSQQQLNSSLQDPLPAYDQQHFMQVPTSELQQALVDAGYNPGPVDGILGGKTRNALTQFQQDRGLQSSGVVDPPTLRALSL